MFIGRLECQSPAPRRAVFIETQSGGLAEAPGTWLMGQAVAWEVGEAPSRVGPDEGPLRPGGVTRVAVGEGLGSWLP